MGLRAAARVGGEDAMARVMPTNALTEPEEVADVFAFLASDSARSITGQNIRMDGGISAGWFQPPV